MLVKNIRHSGIVALDLEKSVGFYEILGFKKVSSGTLTAKQVSKWLCSDDGKLIWVKMKAPSGDLIELYNFKDYSFEGRELFNHISMTVKNVDEVYTIFSGYSFSEPFYDKEKKHKLFFAEDPSGNKLEFVEVL